jgi:hypothetical protein
MRIALAFAVLLLPFSSPAASIIGSLLDPAGAAVTHVAVELNSGTRKYQGVADNAGVYQFADLPAGEYTVTFTHQRFKRLTLKSIGLSEREIKRLPEITLTSALLCGFPPTRDFVRLILSLSFGELSGSVSPPETGVEVTLVCRTFSVCNSTRTDSSGHFSFESLPAGMYGLNFHRDGFYPETAAGYEYTVNAGFESVYAPKSLEPCFNGNCDPKLRPSPPVATCE